MTRDGRHRPIVLPPALGLVLCLTWALPGWAIDGVKESWDAVYIQGTRVGHFHTQVIPVKDRGRELLNVQVDMALKFTRKADDVSIETLYGTIETPEGAVLRLDSRTLVSKQEMRIFGDVIDNQMKLTLSGAGQKQEQTIPWGPDVRGPYGAEMSMARKPMAPGETREIKVFVPDLNRIGVASLTATAVESVVLGGGVKRDLLRVNQNTTIDGKPIPGMAQVHFVDSAGQILRTSLDVFGGMETYRTTKEAATKGITGVKFDLNAASLIAVKRQINNPTNSKEIVYDLAMRGDEPGKVFPDDRRQVMTPGVDPTRARMVVHSAGPELGEPGPESVAPEYLRANSYINSTDTRVESLSRRATTGITDPWKKAAAIQHWVFQNIKKKNFETAFAAASEVARDLEGDCSEHSVLTAAMCRSAGIPCRVVSGLLYVEPNQGFGFHMWNEVYVDRRWVAIDAAWDQSTVDAVHLKLSDSSLDGVSPFETFLSIVRVFDKLAIEPVEVR